MFDFRVGAFSQCITKYLELQKLNKTTVNS